MKPRTLVTIVASALVWAASGSIVLGAFGAVPAAILIALAAAEVLLGASTLIRFETNVFYVAQILSGVAHLVLALWPGFAGVVPSWAAGAALAFGLTAAFCVSLAPDVKTITAIAVRLRRLPAWFTGTAIYRRLDAAYTLIWAAVFAVAAAFLLTPFRPHAGTLLAVAGIGSELLLVVLLTGSGYRYIDFLTGRARDADPAGGAR
jgi:hypothetical protein